MSVSLLLTKQAVEMLTGFDWVGIRLVVDSGRSYCLVQGDTKKRELLKNPTKIEEIQEKKIIDGN